MRKTFSFVVFDLIPFLAILSIIAYLMMNQPILFVGLFVGYVSCKYQTKLENFRDRCLVKVNEAKHNYEEDAEKQKGV